MIRLSSVPVAVLQVWNLENMLPIQCLQRHEKCVNALAMWKDTLYSGSEDTEIKVSWAVLHMTHLVDWNRCSCIPLCVSPTPPHVDLSI